MLLIIRSYFEISKSYEYLLAGFASYLWIYIFLSIYLPNYPFTGLFGYSPPVVACGSRSVENSMLLYGYFDVEMFYFLNYIFGCDKA